MPRSFQEIDRARAVKAIKPSLKSREEITAEQDARNAEATAQLDAEYEMVFGAAESMPAAESYDASGLSEAAEAKKPAAKKSAGKRR